jgi:hypothetical protein
MNIRWTDEYGIPTLSAIVGSVLVGGVLFFVVLFFSITEIARGFDHRACIAFGQTSEREVRFTEYTYVAWDCLTPTSDGKWISTTLLRETS